MAKKKREPDPKDPYDEVTVKLPKYVLGIIRDLEQEVKLPIGRLIGYALDNEMSKGEDLAFRDFDCEIPDTIYIPHAYAEQSARIMKLLERFKYGIGLDGLVLLRFGIGIHDKETFLLAVRELLTEKRIEFRTMTLRPGVYSYQFSKGYQLLFIKEQPIRMPPQGQKLLNAMETENIRLRAENEQLKRGRK